MPTFMFIHDLVDPHDPQGRTYKQVNAAKVHAIPIGALVEDTDSGVRMFVVKQTRDCDMSLLYSLSPCHPNDEEDMDIRMHRHHGWPEYCLKVIEEKGRDEEFVDRVREERWQAERKATQ